MLKTTKNQHHSYSSISNQNGFTIVELLVVIVVIGILAAITIVSYTGITQKATAASLQADLSNASKQIKIFQAQDPNGDFPADYVCPAVLTTDICLKPSGNNIFTYTASNGTNPKTFTLDSTSTNGTKYRVTDDLAPFAVIVDPNWIDGIAATALAGKSVRATDIGTTQQFKTSQTAIASPQGEVGLDPVYLTKMTLVSPQTYPAVDFTAYPAQNACKAIGGRLPNMDELLAIYSGKATYGNNFLAEKYWSATESDSDNVRAVMLSTGDTYTPYKDATGYTRCVKD